MHGKAKRWSLVLLLATGLVTSAASARAADADEQGVRAATGKFYEALNKMFAGDVAPMETVWSHAEDVTYMGPGGGMQVGWKAVQAEWQKQAAMKLGGEVKPSDLHMNVGDTIAVTQNWEKGENPNAGGKVQKVSIRATNTFRKENGAWKMIGHHTDLLDALAQ